MSDTAAILRRARTLAMRDNGSCAHIAIFDATPRGADEAPALQLFADAIGVDITDGEVPIWRWWDAASPAAREAAWARADALAEARG